MTDSAEQLSPASRRRAWFTLILFLLLYVCAMLDRNIINVLVLPIKQDLGIGDFEMGLLLGPAFGLSYVILAFPMAWLADRWSRRGVVFIGIIVWSISNCAAGLTHSFEALFATRIGVGAGEAALVPAAYVLIAQLFPRKSLAVALSIFSMGSVAGMAVGFGLGGWMLDSLGGGYDIPYLGHFESWRLVFFITGIPSLLLAALLYFVPERRVTAADGAAARGVPLMPFLRAHPWAALGIPFAFGMASLCSAAIISWLPAFSMPRFDWSATTAGLVMAVLLAGVSSIGKLGSGVVVDRLFARGMIDAHPRYLLVALAIATPLTIAAFYAGPVAFVILIAAWFLLAHPLQGYGAASIQLITPEALRGRMSALFIVIANIFASVGPTIVGYLSEHVFAGPGSLGLAIVVTVAFWGPVAILLLWLLLAGAKRAVTANAGQTS